MWELDIHCNSLILHKHSNFWGPFHACSFIFKSHMLLCPVWSLVTSQKRFSCTLLGHVFLKTWNPALTLLSGHMDKCKPQKELACTTFFKLPSCIDIWTHGDKIRPDFGCIQTKYGHSTKCHKVMSLLHDCLLQCDLRVWQPKVGLVLLHRCGHGMPLCAAVQSLLPTSG